MAQKYFVHTMTSTNDDTILRVYPNITTTQEDFDWFLDAFDRAIQDVVMAQKYFVHTMTSTNDDTILRVYPNITTTQEDFDWFLDAFDRAIQDVVGVALPAEELAV